MFASDFINKTICYYKTDFFLLIEKKIINMRSWLNLSQIQRIIVILNSTILEFDCQWNDTQCVLESKIESNIICIFTLIIESIILSRVFFYYKRTDEKENIHIKHAFMFLFFYTFLFLFESRLGIYLFWSIVLSFFFLHLQQ
jgi:hypothetical protein